MNNFIKVIKSRFFKKKFLIDFLLLSFGNGFAQLLGIIVLPIITKNFIPKEYSYFAIFSSWAAVFNIMATGCFHLGIVPTLNRKLAQTYRYLSIITGIIMSMLIFFIFFLFSKYIIAELWILPILIIFLSIFQQEHAWNLRHKKIQKITLAKILSTLTQNGIFLLGSWLNPISWVLIVGNFASFIVSIITLKFNNIPKEKSIELKTAFKQGKGYLFFTMPSYLSAMCTRMLPGIIFPFLGFTDKVGLVFLAYKVLYLPSILIGEPLGLIYLNKFRKYSYEQIYLNTLKMIFFLTILALLGIIIINNWGPQVFSLIFGEIWYTSGEYAKYLIFWFATSFIAHSVAFAYQGLNQQKSFLIINVIGLVIQLYIILYLSKTSNNLITIIKLLSIVGFFTSVSILIDVLLLLKKNIKKFDKKVE